MTVKDSMAELQPQFSSDDATPTSWVETRGHLERAKAEVFWLTTVRSDVRPHVTPLLSVWLNGALYFCTGPSERKAKNIARNAHCVLNAGLDLVVEGEATTVSDETELRSVADTYEAKYDPHFTAPDDTFFGLGDAIRGGDGMVYRVAPSTAFGFGKGKPFSQTRWRFS